MARILEQTKGNTVADTVTNGNGAANEAAASKKMAKASLTYVDAEGKESNFPNAAGVIMRTTFSNSVVRELDIRTLPMDKLGNAAALQGFATRTQRSYQAEKDMDKVVEAYDEVVADLANGVWIETKAGAPRVTLLAEAIRITLQNAGEVVDDARFDSIIEKLKTAESRDKAMANVHVVAQLETIKQERQKQRLADARKAAKETKFDAASLGL